MVLSKRNGIYYLWYEDDDGRKRKISTRAHLKSDALKFLRSFDERRETIRRARTHLSVFSVDAVRYAETTLNKGTSKLYSHSLRNFQRMLGDVLLSKITPKHFDMYKSERLKSVSPVSVNVELRTIRSALNLAVRWELIERNPFSWIAACTCSLRDSAILHEGGFSAVCWTLSPNPGSRMLSSSLLSPDSSWRSHQPEMERCNMERRVILIHSQEGFRTKTGKSRFIPMNNVALQLVDEPATESQDRIRLRS